MILNIYTTNHEYDQIGESIIIKNLKKNQKCHLATLQCAGIKICNKTEIYKAQQQSHPCLYRAQANYILRETFSLLFIHPTSSLL